MPTKYTATKVNSTKNTATSDSANNPEIDESDLSKKVEELKVKLFLSRNIDGLEKSFVPNKELSTKLVYMMDQSKQFEDGFNTENESTEEISIFIQKTKLIKKIYLPVDKNLLSTK